MKINSTHKNLDTAYVNLSALLKFLRQKKFVGRVHFEAKSYEADIFFTPESELNARENDRSAGRISAGREVLSRILVRASVPGGIINVYDEIEEKAEKADESSEPQTEAPSIRSEPVIIGEPAPQNEPLEESAKPKAAVSLKEKLGLPSLPFSFRKKALKKSETEILGLMPEEKIIEKPLEEDHLRDWHELLELVGEILQTVEASLAASSLNFVWVFERVRTEVFEEYPFLHPNSTVFAYKNGRVSMTEQINNNLFVASIAESLRRLLEKFETHPKFAEVHRSVIRNLLELMNKRHAQYDKFLISQQLEKVLEI